MLILKLGESIGEWGFLVYLLLIDLFMAVLGLPFGAQAPCCCTWAFSSCGKWELLSSCGARASHCSGFFCFGAQVLGHLGSGAVVHGLNCPTACGI